MGPLAPDGLGRPLLACWARAKPGLPGPSSRGANRPLGRDPGLVQPRLDLARVPRAWRAQG
eukprot:11926290-Alexandrium_andersonii.AAC.1